TVRVVVCLFFQAEDGIRDDLVTGVQTCALPILNPRFARLVLGELHASASKKRFVERARELVPLIDEGDLVLDTAGIRAQLLNDRGELVDDFVLEWGHSSIHVLNSVSPGMTCAMPFASSL